MPRFLSIAARSSGKKGRRLPSTQQTYAVTCCCQHWGRDVQRSWAPTAYSVDAVAAAVLVLA
jgi:hypothetical protein